MKSYTELILTVYDRPNDKYTCNVCSALLNIRPANAVGKAYHYFLLSTSQHSLPASQSPLLPNCHQPFSAPTTSHLLTSSLRDEEEGEQPCRRFKHPANMFCVHDKRDSTSQGLHAASAPSNTLAYIMEHDEWAKQNRN